MYVHHFFLFLLNNLFLYPRQNQILDPPLSFLFQFNLFRSYKRYRKFYDIK